MDAKKAAGDSEWSNPNNTMACSSDCAIKRIKPETAIGRSQSARAIR
jgi:hypothetical protein